MQYNQGFYEVTAYNIPGIDLDLFVYVSNLRSHNMHWQSSVEILCRLEGEVTVIVEQESYHLGPGDVFVIDSHRPHAFRDGSEKGLHILLGFSDTILHRNGNETISLSTVGPGALPKDHPEIHQLRTLCGQIAERCFPLYMKYPQNSLAYRDLLQKLDKPLPPLETIHIDSQDWHGVRADLQLLCQLLLRHTRPADELPRTLPADFVRCVDYVQTHFFEPLTVDSITQACAISRRSIYRMFQQYMGMPLWEYVTFLRVQYACYLLRQNRFSIAQVAAQVGLSDSQFFRVFQQVTGMTPRNWQQGSDQMPSKGPAIHQFTLAQSQIGDTAPADFDWDWISGRKGWSFT